MATMPVCALCGRYITGASVLLAKAKQVHSYCANIEGYKFVDFGAKVISKNADKSYVRQDGHTGHNED